MVINMSSSCEAENCSAPRAAQDGQAAGTSFQPARADATTTRRGKAQLNTDRIVTAYAITSRQQASHLDHLAAQHWRDDKVPYRSFGKLALAASLLFLLPNQQADLKPV